MGMKHKPIPSGVSSRWVLVLCIASFCFGIIVVNRFWVLEDSSDQTNETTLSRKQYDNKELPIPVKCSEKKKDHLLDGRDILTQVSQTHEAIIISNKIHVWIFFTNIRTLDKTISSLEMQLAAARAAPKDDVDEEGSKLFSNRPKVFLVMGIMTAFSSRKRRDSIRETWMPQGDELMKLEKEKGIIIRFVIGHSASPGGVLDRAIEAEVKQHQDFLPLNHIEGYHELSSKTQIYFSTASSQWDADFYVKVDDDVHVNLGMVGSTLARHRSKPRVYIGCMKSGPVLSQKGVKYHEPEYWKFGEDGNKYFRHATGQIYAISKDLATYISVNKNLLHKYANEDVSLGSWFIGLDVEHIDDRSLCCGSPPDCEWKTQAGNPCAATFDWSCSGICKSVERMMEVHQRCGEGDGAIWHTSF
ncbi:beta-1,6-galactosyltransferase GALT31A-like [Impatiens glandulifera]|uniref:beta-1,6-galactosyltransferase GALT31A-like n=1 Tax=Impatiens glandulifera TaxID=253017 RepID=UPI001FB130D4|nr:beta-1,6-galactosyltransferase GALT31A-like [Impatiens glandulifera]